MKYCEACHGAVLDPNKVYGYSGPVCGCPWKSPDTYRIHPHYLGGGPGSGGGGGNILSIEAQTILYQIAALQKQINELSKKIEEAFK